jgi:hypothetical protein
MILKLRILLMALLAVIALNIHAQLESVIVEKYYVSDAMDASDTTGGRLSEGSVTYRVYADLAEGSRIISIFGDSIHPLVFKSTTPFFNNAYRGKSFGYSITSSSLIRNTMALDTWLTMGYATNKHIGLPKSLDPDTSIVGGLNNDGGSAEVVGGLLVNSNSELGLPLTLADGLLQITELPEGFVSQGFIDIFTGEDSSIFGNTNSSDRFIGKEVFLYNSTGIGNLTAENHVLLAQLTTSGELSFELNLEVAFIQDEVETTIKYMAKDTLLDNDMLNNKWLSYPADCGCTDPAFVEYKKDATCDDGSCITPVILGCTDPLACNFDPEANMNVPELCCFNSECSLDLEAVCPGIVYGCTDPAALNFNPLANASSDLDRCYYPGDEGCRSPLYLEFDPEAIYDDGSHCKLLIIKGCTDKQSCNYNPFANVHDEDSCAVFCEQKKSFPPESEYEKEISLGSLFEMKVFPNPVSSELYYTFPPSKSTAGILEIYDLQGNILISEKWAIQPATCTNKVNISELTNGMYILRITLDNKQYSENFIKQ